MKHIFILIALANILSAQPRYDLLLQGGHVIDEKNNISGGKDVAIRDGKIAAGADHTESTQAFKVVSVRGLYWTPGLVDIHGHVYAGTAEPGWSPAEKSVYRGT